MHVSMRMRIRYIRAYATYACTASEYAITRIHTLIHMRRMRGVRVIAVGEGDRGRVAVGEIMGKSGGWD